MCSKVSVIIPMYNSSVFILETITSVFNQDYNNMEVIVVNDGSTDDSADKVISKFNEKVKLINTANHGVSSARNTGILAATGDYIAFIDSDDVWAANKIGKQIRSLENDESIGVSYTDRQLIDKNSQFVSTNKRKHYEGYILNNILISNFICLSSVLVRKECFEQCGYFDTKLTVSEDYDLWIRISSKFKFVFLDEKLVYYRITPGSLTKNNFRMYYHAFIVFSKNTCNSEISTQISIMTYIKFYADTYKSMAHNYYDQDDIGNALKLFTLSTILYPFRIETIVMLIRSILLLIINGRRKEVAK
ncbi:MAG: glycosyltransferase [Geobacteraceae bacterium]|nr:glycosyltransferase [Geobacteraceae bacterium]NTW79750.1 glycosyltransferase [Geobacteraceae bacterium]